MTDNATITADPNNTPVPVTSNDWFPIQAFEPGADYAGGPFLVWFGKGRWSEAWLENGKFMGEWRHVVDGPGGKPVPEIADMEPIAFKLVDGPDPDTLKLIVETHFKEAA
jgi:hypothetical protein